MVVHCSKYQFREYRSRVWLLKIGTEWIIHFVRFQIICPEAMQYFSLNPKNFYLGIANPKLKLYVNNRKITKRSVIRPVPFRVLETRVG